MANFIQTVEVHRFAYTPDNYLSIFLYIQQIMKLVKTPTVGV